MATTPTPVSTAPPAAAVVRHSGEHSYVDWPAIFAGAVFAAAISFVLITFGSGIGLAMMSPEPGEGASLFWITVTAGLWFIWVVISSFAAGGYIAGRMRRKIGDATADEVETRDGAHGVLVWATGALIATMMAVFGAGGMLNAAVSGAGAAAGSAAEVAGEQSDYFSGLILRGDGTPASPEARAEVATVLGRSIVQGEVTPADRTYLAQIVATERNIDPAEAQTQVDAALGEVEEMREQAVEAAEQARIVGVIAAFLLAATLLVGAAAAYFAATTGGRHRDENLPFSRFGGR